MKSLADLNTWKSIAKGAGLAATGAVATYLLTYFAGLDWGPWQPTAAAVFAVAANALRKFGFEH